MIQALAVDYTI